MLFVFLLSLSAVHLAPAQKASFNGIQTTIATGLNAAGGVAVDSTGAIYVADTGNARVLKLSSAAGVLDCSVAANCTVLGSGYNKPTAIAIDANQNVYFAESITGRVLRIAAGGGTATVVAGGTVGLTRPSGLAIDQSGNLYVSSTIGVVWVPAGGSQGTYTYGFSQATGLAVDANQNLYVADKGTNQLVKVAPNRQLTVLATGLNAPAGVAVDSKGMVYVSDQNNNRILKIPSTASSLDCSVAGNCTPVANDPSVPQGLAVDRNGNLLFATSNQLAKSAQDVDFGSLAVGSATPSSQTLNYSLSGVACTAASTVKVLTQGAANQDFGLSAAGSCTPGAPSKFSLTIALAPQLAGLRTGAVQLLDGSGIVQATTYLHGIGVAPQIAWTSGSIANVVSGLTSPLSTAVDGSGNVYLADSGLSSIVKIPAGCASLSCTVNVGSGLAQPTGVAVDASGNVYTTLSGSGSLVQVPWNAGTSSYGTPVTLASGLSLSATTPSGIAVDAAGNVYATDTNNSRVVKIPWNGNANAFGPTGIVVSGNSIVPAPTGVAVDAAGSVYIADATAQKVLQILTDGTQTTLAGAVNASSVSLDGSGSVYYADRSANTVTKLPWTGTSFGTPVSLISTGLSGPSGLSVAANGSVYVVNNTALTVSKLDAASPPSLSFASTRLGATSTDSPKSVSFSNIGNAALTFPVLASTNPSISTGFVLDNATTCPQVFTTSSAQTLAQGSGCGYAVSFKPTSTNAGSNSGSLIATDSNLNAASPGYATQTVPLSATGIPDDTSTVTVTFAPVSPLTFGQAVSVSAAVRSTTSPSTTATGNVTFTDTDGSSQTTNFGGTVALSGGTATATSYTPASAGTHTITATYSGAVGTIAASSGSATLVINKSTPALTYAPVPSTQVYGTAIAATALNAQALDLNGAAVAGTFAYTTLVGTTPTTLVAGSTVLPVGTYTITAIFTPTDTADYVAGGTKTASYTVTQGTATVTLGNLSQTYSGSASAATATTTPTGLSTTITYNGGAAVPVNAGSYAVVATVSDPNYNGTANGTLVIAKATSTITLGNLSQTYSGSGRAATVTTAPVGLSTSITYNGSSTLPVAAGSYTVVATVTDANYTGTSSGTLIIAKAAPAISLTASTNPILVQGGTTFTATVASGTVPSGSVIFMDGTTAIGSAALANGTATLTATFSTTGTHSITAVYSGDLNFAAVTSAAFAESVQDFSLGLASSGVSSVSVTGGATASYLLAVTPTGPTLLGPVALSVSGLPAGATATFSPATVANGGAATNVTMSIVTPKTTALLQRERPLGKRLAPISLGLLLLPFAWRFRRSAMGLRRLGSLAGLLIASAALLAGLTGCGSGGTNVTATPSKTYTLTVTATSGTVAHSTTVTLIVN